MPEPRSPRTTFFLVAATLAAWAMAGCTSVQSTATAAPDEAGNGVAAPPPPATSDRGLAGVTTDLPFAADRPAPAVRTAPTLATGEVDFGPPIAADAGRAVSVGLYGELTPRSPRSSRYDGASNLVQVTRATEGAAFDPALDRLGKTLAFASTQHRRTSDIYIKAVNGHTLTQVTTDPADDVMPAFAPDSHRIAFASNRSGNWDIFVTNVDGDPAVQLTFDAAHELHPTWSPDGKTIAYCKLGAQSGRWEIWMIDGDDASSPRFLEYGLFPQWNPDPGHNRIVFQRARERGSRLFGVWTIDLVGGEALHPTEIVSAANAAAMHPAWSPDGSRIVFVTVVDPDRPGGPRPEEADVWVVNADGTGRTNLTNGKFLNLHPVWAVDGTVYFLSDRSGVDNIWAATTGRTPGSPRTWETPVATADEAGDPENDRP